MKRLELLIDVLEENGFHELKEDREKEHRDHGGIKTRQRPDEEEIAKIRKALKEMKVPKPTDWASAIYTRDICELRKRFSPEAAYDYTDLCNLYTTLVEAVLIDSEITRKIEAMRTSLKFYAK